MGKINMEYLFVKWIHDFPDEPVLLISEIDNARMELRKIEVFADGTKGFADEFEHTENTQLSELPIPTVDEIAKDNQFQPKVINRIAFEKLWIERTSNHSPDLQA